MEFFKISSMISMFYSLGRLERLNPLSSYDSISNFEDYINHYVYLFLLGGTLVLNELHFDSGGTETIKIEQNYFNFFQKFH